MKKYIADEIWNSLPILDFRPRFFIETYLEKLDMYTPHFAQARLMNVFSSCEEALIYIQEYRANDKNSGYILLAIAEIDHCLLNDRIANEMFEHIKEYKAELFKKLNGGDFSPTMLNSLSVICKFICAQEGIYAEKLLSAIKSTIFSSQDLTKVKRLTDEIYQLTGLYVIYLLNKGYSPTYLFNRIDLFTRPNNYSGKTFSQQFDIVTDKLKTHTANYDVYFAIHTNKLPRLLSIKNNEDFVFDQSQPSDIPEKDFNKLIKGLKPNLFVKSTINATDYVAASWRVKDKLDKLLDAITALETNPKVHVSKTCVAISKNNNLTHTRTLNIDLLLSFLTSEGESSFSKNTTIIDAFTKLDSQGYEQLSRSLRYLRLARESASLEQKLLNLWIAIESLFSYDEGNVLSRIQAFIPDAYALSALLRRVEYIRDLLVKNNISTTALIKEKTNIKHDHFDDNAKVADIFSILTNDDVAKELFNSLGTKEHLKFKIISTVEELKDNKSILKRISKSKIDVDRQLRRIYFLRNKIAHTGHYANIRPQLVTHLLDYLAICYSSILRSANKASLEKGQSVIDLLTAYKMGVDIVIIRLNSQNKIINIDELTPTPVI